jgi:hypothetical protein
MPAPDELIKISEKAISHPNVTKAGITKAPDGHYALLATVSKGTSTPIPEIEAMAEDYPVIYREETDSPPVAWPAKPGRERSPR